MSRYCRMIDVSDGVLFDARCPNYVGGVADDIICFIEFATFMMKLGVITRRTLGDKE